MVAQQPVPGAVPGSVIAVRAGRLVDPAVGTATANQMILVQDGKITAVGENLAIPQGAQVIDLSRSTLLPGLVDAHTHLAMTMMPGFQRKPLEPMRGRASMATADWPVRSTRSARLAEKLVRACSMF